jgi:hypothetical protein
MSGAADAYVLLANTRITEDGIQALIAGLDSIRAAKVAGVLRRYLGWTWKSALDTHSTDAAPVQPVTSSGGNK